MISQFFKRNAAGFLAGGVFAFVACGNVFALETLTITDSVCGGCTVSLGPVVNGNDLMFAGVVGAWNISVTAQDLSDATTPVDLDLDVVGSTGAHGEFNAATVGTITVAFTETGYTGSPLLVLSAGDGGTDQGTKTTSNVSVAGVNQPAISYNGAAGSAGLNVVPYNFSVSDVNIVPASQPFGVTITTVINPANISKRSASSNYQMDGTLAPEPRFYGLTGLGLAGLLVVAAARRRKNRETVA